MIEIPVHNMAGEQVDSLKIDEQSLGGEVRPVLLKQAYVRCHANRRQGSAHTRNRSEKIGSNRKLYRQKGTGNARRGNLRTNIMRGGGNAFGKKPKSWRLGMPKKMRRLASRNAMLAKAVDGEIKIVDQLQFKKPSTKDFSQLLGKLTIDRSCLVALSNTTDSTALSAGNLENINLIRIDQLNVFDLLNHRFLLVDRPSLESWLDNGAKEQAAKAEDS